MLLWAVLLISASYVGSTSAASIGTTANVIDAIPKNGKLIDYFIRSRNENNPLMKITDRSDFILYELINAVDASKRTDVWFKNIDRGLDALNKTLHAKFTVLEI